MPSLPLPAGSALDEALLLLVCGKTERLWGGRSNVCMHYFRRDFLESVAMRLHTEGHFHVAHKSIPSVDGPVKVPPGYLLAAEIKLGYDQQPAGGQ